jgi:hypothetical protein
MDMNCLFRFFACIYMLGQFSGTADCQIREVDSVKLRTEQFFERVNSKTLGSIEKKYNNLQNNISCYSVKSLEKLQKQEAKILKKLMLKDSLAAKQLLSNGINKYTRLINQVKEPVNTSGLLNSYMPKLDSMQNAFAFLNKSGAGIPGVPVDKLEQVKGLSDQMKNLQVQLQTATNIQKFVKERKEQLREQLDKFQLGNELKSWNKKAYYYQQQLSEYKSIINDPKKIEEKVLTYVKEFPAFKEFMSKNSFLSQFFPTPIGYGTPAALQGLQTRINVQQQLSQQLGAGANPQQYMQQQVQLVQGEINKLKNKINQMGGSSSDLIIPDFKPNSQKTKGFWKRMEYGINIQSQKTNALLPTTSDFALTAGYKLNDKSTMGFGASYKLGWGKDISNIHLTSQGISLRSFVDIKIKGSIWISGGYEENYLHEFTKIDQLKNVNAWQKSGMIGLTKKYKIGKKSGNLQVLWDFLSYSQVPRTQPLKFRVGYVL